MKKSTYYILLVLLWVGCTSKSNNDQGSQPILPEHSVVNDDAEETDCGYEDGSYSATVKYKNPETGHKATYALDVEVEECQVIQINFENGGYLDADHITNGGIDENGKAMVEGEEGKTYEIQLENLDYHSLTK